MEKYTIRQLENELTQRRVQHDRKKQRYERYLKNIIRDLDAVTDITDIKVDEHIHEVTVTIDKELLQDE